MLDLVNLLKKICAERERVSYLVSNFSSVISIFRLFGHLSNVLLRFSIWWNALDFDQTECGISTDWNIQKLNLKFFYSNVGLNKIWFSFEILIYFILIIYHFVRVIKKPWIWIPFLPYICSSIILLIYLILQYNQFDLLISLGS